MTPVDDELRRALFAFATRVFRDQADRDYIAARLSYRAQLRDQFLWSALQALEKYFKGILLFNERPTEELRPEQIFDYFRLDHGR
jgi:HEPN domain-containing protein